MSDIEEWDAQLFRRFKGACALDPHAAPGDWKLLDVLIKKQASSERIIVGRAGPLGKLGHWTDDSSEDRISEGLKALKANERSEEAADFEKGCILGYTKFNIKSSASFLGKLVGAVVAKALSARFQAEEEIKCEIHNVTFEKVDQDFLNEFFTDPPTWTPDVDKLKLFGWPNDWFSGARHLWVVSQIFYCTKITVDAGGSRAVDGSLHLLGDGSIGAALGLGGVEAKVSQTSTGSWEVEAPKLSNGEFLPMAFAFKAVHLQYDKAGERVLRISDSVEKRLERRAGALTDPDSLDPDDDAEFHVGDLFVRPPGDDGVQSWKPNCLLPIQNISSGKLS